MLVVPSSPFHYVVCFWKARAILLDLPRLFLEKIARLSKADAKKQKERNQTNSLSPA